MSKARIRKLLAILASTAILAISLCTAFTVAAADEETNAEGWDGPRPQSRLVGAEPRLAGLRVLSLGQAVNGAGGPAGSQGVTCLTGASFSIK